MYYSSEECSLRRQVSQRLTWKLLARPFFIAKGVNNHLKHNHRLAYASWWAAQIPMAVSISGFDSELLQKHYSPLSTIVDVCNTTKIISYDYNKLNLSISRQVPRSCSIRLKELGRLWPSGHEVYYFYHHGSCLPAGFFSSRVVACYRHFRSSHFLNVLTNADVSRTDLCISKKLKTRWEIRKRSWKL